MVEVGFSCNLLLEGSVLAVMLFEVDSSEELWDSEELCEDIFLEDYFTKNKQRRKKIIPSIQMDLETHKY